MEASRLVATGASVRLEGDALVIDGFTESDRYVVDAVGTATNVEECLHRILGVGARSISATDAASGSLLVQASFDGMTRTFNDVLERAGADVVQATARLLDNDGEFQGLLRERVRDVERLLLGTFDPDNRRSAPAKLEAVMKSVAEDHLLAMSRALDPRNPDGPLAEARRDIIETVREQAAQTTNMLSELTERLAVSETEARLLQLQPRKGFRYEDIVHASTVAIATVLGDVAEPVGRLTGRTGSKVGDEMVTLNEEDTGGVGARYVLENKDKRVPRLADVLKELGEAMENREALAGIAVFSHQENAPTRSSFQYFGRKAIVVLDKTDLDDRALRLACAWARWVVRRQLDDRGHDFPSSGTVIAAINEARQALTRAGKIRNALGVSRKKIGEAETGVDELVQEADATLDALQLLMRKVPSGA